MIPDGPEEMTAFYEEAYERDIDDADLADMLATESRDALELVATERLIDFSVARILEGA
jgi:hypothetical protein